MNWFERAIMFVAPSWAQQRARARLAARHFESASFGRRTSGWSRPQGDANAAAAGATLGLLRAQARDLVRNNSWARRGLRRLCSDTVGWGIRPVATGRGAARVMELWKLWAETTDCDAAGRLTFYGLQRLAMRTIAESGEVLIRRRFRRIEDGLAVPLQLQVLEPDYIDTSKGDMPLPNGGEIIQGVEFDAIGKRVAYWLFDRHPGSVGPVVSPVSRRIPAESVLHIYDQERAGQVRGTSWFASIDVRLHDFDEFEGATLLKQKMAACLAVFTSDIDGTASPLGQGGTDRATGQPTDTFEPGMIVSLQPGRQVTVANPPTATDHASFSATALRGVAAGIGTTYEDLSGDYSQANYSSQRAARIAHQSDVESWQWHMLVPQLCAPAWRWMLDAMTIAGEDVEIAPADWSPSPMALLDPDKELNAIQKAIRNGLTTWPQAIAALGYDPRSQLKEIVAFNKELDAGGVVIDCDPRRTNMAGQQQAPAAQPGTDAPAAAAAGDDEGAAAGASEDENDDDAVH